MKTLVLLASLSPFFLPSSAEAKPKKDVVYELATDWVRVPAGPRECPGITAPKTRKVVHGEGPNGPVIAFIEDEIAVPVTHEDAAGVGGQVCRTHPESEDVRLCLTMAIHSTSKQVEAGIAYNVYVKIEGQWVVFCDSTFAARTK